MTNMEHIVVQWSDVKAMMYTKLRDNKRTGQKGLDHYLNPAVEDPESREPYAGINGVHDFTYEDGGEKKRPNTFEALHWIDYGFTSDAMMHSAHRVPMGFETRPAWNEDDGDIDVGRLSAGYDDFYLGRTEQKSKPGIRVQFDCWFSAGVPNTVISEYGRWIMSLIYSMESQGWDLTIDAYAVIDNLRERDRHRTGIAIRVKNQKENHDTKDYSCLFSPIGTRICTFTAMGTACAKTNSQVGRWFGTAVSGRTWDLNYNPEEGLVSITAAQMAVWNSGSAFPHKELTEKAVAAGLIPAQ